jgi:aspartate aminotransferase-like enzyme
MQPMDAPQQRRLPDPWLFDSEALLRELDRCRETVLQIPITNPNATHFGIQLAVNAIYNLTENLRYLLHLHREQQRAIRKKHEQSLAQALSERRTEQPNIVPIHAPAPNGTTQQHRKREHSHKETHRRRRAAFQRSASLQRQATGT